MDVFNGSKLCCIKNKVTEKSNCNIKVEVTRRGDDVDVDVNVPGAILILYAGIVCGTVVASTYLITKIIGDKIKSKN